MSDLKWCSDVSLAFFALQWAQQRESKVVSCPGQWECSLKSVSKQISAVANSLSLHILLSVTKSEGSDWVRWGEVSGSDRVGPF